MFQEQVAHSFSTPLVMLQNVYAPDSDPEMTVERYERSFEQNEELGLNDMKTENYGENTALLEAAKDEQLQQAHLLEVSCHRMCLMALLMIENPITGGSQARVHQGGSQHEPVEPGQGCHHRRRQQQSKNQCGQECQELGQFWCQCRWLK